MSSPVIALSRYQRALVLDPAEARDLSIRRRINAAWGLLCLNTMTFVAGYSVLGIPSKVGKGFAQAALPLAILLLLTVNPKLKIRPNVFLCIVCLLVLDTVITATQVNRLGTDFRTFRFAEFVLALWLLTPWWGRRDLLLLRCHLLWLYIALGSVLFGLLISPGRAFSYGGRLTGVIWPMLPTQIAGYAAVACGLTVMLWLGRLVQRARHRGWRRSDHRYPPPNAYENRADRYGCRDIPISGLSLFAFNARVRKFFVAVIAVVSIAVMTLAGVITTWLARGESSQGLTSLTGRTNFWALVLNMPRNKFQEIFGFGLSNASVNGLPIDSNWLASYMQEGLFGVVGCAFRPCFTCSWPLSFSRAAFGVRWSCSS